MLREVCCGEFVSVDPGVSKGHGFAHFSLYLLSCGVANAPLGVLRDCSVVVETPTIAFAGTVPTIIALARAAERAVRNWPERDVYYVAPQDWKAGTKAQHQLNVWDALSDAERGVVVSFARERGLRKLLTADTVRLELQTRCAKSLAGKRDSEWVLGNVIDAIGLGLWAQGRIDKFGRRGRYV